MQWPKADVGVLDSNQYLLLRNCSSWHSKMHNFWFNHVMCPKMHEFWFYHVMCPKMHEFWFYQVMCPIVTIVPFPSNISNWCNRYVITYMIVAALHVLVLYMTIFFSNCYSKWDWINIKYLYEFSLSIVCIDPLIYKLATYLWKSYLVIAKDSLTIQTISSNFLGCFAK